MRSNVKHIRAFSPRVTWKWRVSHLIHWSSHCGSARILNFVHNLFCPEENLSTMAVMKIVLKNYAECHSLVTGNHLRWYFTYFLTGWLTLSLHCTSAGACGQGTHTHVMLNSPFLTCTNAKKASKSHLKQLAMKRMIFLQNNSKMLEKHHRNFQQIAR